MTGAHDPYASLLEALELSPDNVPLRQHVASMLLGHGRLDEAEAIYRDGLRLAPASEQLRLGLAQVLCEQGGHSQALVIVEEMLAKPNAPAAAHMLMARLALRAGERERAARAYERAIALDPKLADADLATDVGYQPRRSPVGSDFDTSFEEFESMPLGREVLDDENIDDEGRVRVARDDFDPGDGGAAEVERPRIDFRHVGGMESLKDEIRIKVIHPITHPEIYKAYGKAIGGGILFYGPPGCGKTHLARATAGEVQAGFISIGIHDVLDMWIGSSEQRLHAIFDQARRSAPCVLFFDEVDALGASRTDMRQSSARQLINQFLSELDGANASNEGVLILAATNAPWHLDSAFRRPGRFDRILFVPPPDAEARAAILRIHLQGKPVRTIDHEQIAAKTDRFSGADLKAVVDAAVEEKLREAMKSGVPEPLGTKDLLRAAKGLRPSTSEWFATARNYALYANQGGQYDEILGYIERR